jgi:hypothetical protein
MRKLILIASFAALGLTSPAIAHPEDEGMSVPRGPSTGELAQEAVNKLVAQKKLPASWTDAKMTKFDYREKNGGQYVLIFENPKVKDVAKRKLFVVMTTDGKLVSTGHKLV